MSAAVSGLGMTSAPHAMTGASMRMPPAQKMSNLFDKIDTSGIGSITKVQLGQAFNALNPPYGFKSMGADAVFTKLDPKGTGAVSKQDFINGMASMMYEIRQQRQLHRQEATQQPAPTQTVYASLNQLSQMTIGSHINTTA